MAKGMVIEEIDVAFARLEKEMMMMLSGKQNALAGNNCCYIDEAFQTLTDSLNHLNKRVKSLNGEKCLASVIAFIEKEHE